MSPLSTPPEVEVEGLVVHDGDARGLLAPKEPKGVATGGGRRRGDRNPWWVALFLLVLCPEGAEASRDSQGATWPAPTRRFSCTSSSRPKTGSSGSLRTFASACTSTWAASFAARRACSTRS